MQTYNPILSREKLEKRRIGAPRPRGSDGVARVLYGRGASPLVLQRGDQMTLGEMLFGGYTDSYEIDMTVKRLDRNVDLPCRGDAHQFGAVLSLVCQVADPRAVVENNIDDAGTVLWSVVLGNAREVSRQFNLAETAEAERAIAGRLGGMTLHPAFLVQSVGVGLSPDKQAVDIGRMQTNMTFWNAVVDSPLAAAYLAHNPGDVPGALAVVREQRQQLEAELDAFQRMGGRVDANMKRKTKELIDRHMHQLGLPSHPEITSDGIRPVLPPREQADPPTEEEEDDT
jgi:hypothetical protein